MEWKSNLRRVQSLHSVTGQWDQKTSVSQLVARYQTTVEVKTPVQTTSVKEITTCLPENTESCLASLIKRDDEKRERSPIKAALSRSKSMVSLQTSSSAGIAAGSGSGSGSGSLGALKALFESKSKTPQINQVKSFRAADVMSHRRTTDVVATLTNGEVEEEEEKVPAPVAATNDATKRDAQQDHVTRKVMDRTRTERRRTVIGGIDFEKLAASQADEKRRSIADFRDSSFLQTKEKLSVSVKAMSALYQSKVATQEPTHNLLKPAQNLSSESGKRVKLTKFQPTCQDKCSACLKPVYPMEKITADKYIFHKTCFCCKQCKKKLSMYNYTPLHGEFYCIFHYKQLFRRKGNYDEGFGHIQHKNQWLVKKTAEVAQDESEA